MCVKPIQPHAFSALVKISIRIFEAHMGNAVVKTGTARLAAFLATNVSTATTTILNVILQNLFKFWVELR